MTPSDFGGRARPLDVACALLVAASMLGGCGAQDPAVRSAAAPAPSAAPASPAVASPAVTSPAVASPAVASAAPSARPESPSPDPGASPSPAPSALPEAEEFALDLYRRGDFVAQYTFEWCVGASLQMTWNMVKADERTSRVDQQKLWERARDTSASPFGGANPRGWTTILNELGIGPYALVSIPDHAEALRVAARAIRETERPVGLVMWRGRHAWVMSGFESIGDPMVHRDFEVTGVRVLDPLYPHGSSVWGPSPRPNSLLKPSKLAEQFVIRDSRRVNLGVPPGYLLVLPTAG